MVEHYCREWEIKYGSRVLLDEYQAMWLIKSLKNYMRETTIELITHYFKMREHDFEREAHSTELFYKNVNRINASMAKMNKSGETGVLKRGGHLHPIDSHLFTKGYRRENGRMYRRDTGEEVPMEEAKGVVAAIRRKLHVPIDGSQDDLLVPEGLQHTYRKR